MVDFYHIIICCKITLSISIYTMWYIGIAHFQEDLKSFLGKLQLAVICFSLNCDKLNPEEMFRVLHVILKINLVQKYTNIMK